MHEKTFRLSSHTPEQFNVMIYRLKLSLLFIEPLTYFALFLNFIYKFSFIVYLQDDRNSLLLFKQPSWFNAYITAVASFRPILHTGLLSSAIVCAVFITTKVIIKSMCLRFSFKHTLKAQYYFRMPLKKKFYD